MLLTPVPITEYRDDLAARSIEPMHAPLRQLCLQAREVGKSDN
jgi:hypothetical protein